MRHVEHAGRREIDGLNANNFSQSNVEIDERIMPMLTAHREGRLVNPCWERENALFSGDVLGSEFHQLFRINSDHNRKDNADKKKSKKRTKLGKDKERRKSKQSNGNSDSVPIQPPFVEVFGNPSIFAVYAGVRHSVVEKYLRDTFNVLLSSNIGALSDSGTDDEEEKTKDSHAKLPKIVGIGLCSVFELISESYRSHPDLCTRALEALLDMLQGQQPEGLKTEPPEVIDALFDLLLQLATSRVVENAQKDAKPSRLTSVACACLLSLVVARGDTGKLLNATAAILMSHRTLASEDIKMPSILTLLQQSLHAVLLGKTAIPDWLSHGILKKALIDSFPLSLPHKKKGDSSEQNDGSDASKYAMASDGRHLYIHSSVGGLYKVGSGYGGTIKGHIYAHRPGFRIGQQGWLGFAGDQLFYKPSSSTNSVFTVDKDTLSENNLLQLEEKYHGPSLMFTDGESIGTVLSSKDDSFVVRTFSPHRNPMPCIGELPLKLARKCLDMFGWAAFDEGMSAHSIPITFEDEPCMIAAGKEFAIIRTTSGKILYSGKPQSLGIKHTTTSGSKWAELPITKSPKIIQYSVGHEGLHALLVAEDGSVFFIGLPRRGEDGDQSKSRRHPKPVKPKKMIKMEGHHVVHSACNNGTSALITKDGELYMFGKDTAYCMLSTGLVSDLKDVHLSQVVLGKAHVLALSNRGHIYTFGINNKGQCGRDFVSHTKEALTVAMVTTNEEECEDEDVESEEPDIMCPASQHKWRQDECMVCTVCGECTGFGVSCISKGQPDRNPGLPCGCGWGDSGCSECGCCKTCAGENKPMDPTLAAELDIMMRRRPHRIHDQLLRKLEERRPRPKARLPRSLKTKSSRNLTVDGPQEKMVAQVTEEVVSSDPERETSKISSLAPARVYLPHDSAVTGIACGLHHSVILLQNGYVFTFGSNQHGQLGLGDLVMRGAPTLVQLPVSAIQVAAGSNHSVVLLNNGQVYTFGSYQKGQLGRTPPTAANISQDPDNGVKKDKMPKETLWYCLPGPVPHIGPRQGRRASWVGASGDQTYLKMDESLINAHNLDHSKVSANKNCICLIPTCSDRQPSFVCLVISKVDGNCRSFNDPEQADLSAMCTCLDPANNVAWSYDPARDHITCYNPLAAEARNLSLDVPYRSASNGSPPAILTAALATPVYPGYAVSRSQAALNILGCLDTLTRARELNLGVQEDDGDRQSVAKVYSREDFSVVNRFENHGGGWGYSGHSIEAVRFMADTDCLLGGFGLFGGRGEYTGKVRLYDIGMDGGEQEIDGELLAESEEVPYECGARQKFSVLFDEPVALQANRWYVAWARVSGPSSDCGSNGQCLVTTEDQVMFYFKSSKKSNNGTDVNAGQIPQLLYRVIAHENHSGNNQSEVYELVNVLSKEFASTVTPTCLQSLLQLLDWSWKTLKTSLTALHESPHDSTHTAAMLDLERLVYIGCASLRLLRTYINEVYPNEVGYKKAAQESLKLVECIADVRELLHRILSDPVIMRPRQNEKDDDSENLALNSVAKTLLEECHSAFVACFHTFYPTANLKWSCVCNLLAANEGTYGSVDGCDQLLAAVLASLCNPTVKLTSILPILGDQDHDSSPRKQPINDVINDVGLVDDALGWETCYPLLVEHMIWKAQLGVPGVNQSSFREVLDRLLAIAVKPVKQVLRLERWEPSTKLVANTCAFLAAIVAELAAQTTGVEVDLHSGGGRVQHVTPSRFTRTSATRTWNTGNGSPDAICFSVDRPGIVISGVCVYGGVGMYDYELELLDDQNGSSNDPSHTQKWNSLEIVRGAFGPDDCVGDIVEMKFDRAVAIRESVKYAIRLRNHGGRTSNGDGGLSSVKGPDGTTFTFSTCSLSFNGTNHMRGQIPQIIYYSTPQDSDAQQSNRAVLELQARCCALTTTNLIVRAATDLLARSQDVIDEATLEAIASAHITSVLLPSVLAHIGPVATSDPRSAVQVLNLIQEVLPPIANLNNRYLSLRGPLVCETEALTCTTSNHYATVESDHPYRAATVANYKVCFPDSVKWMSVEFDPNCGTVQAEDCLHLCVPKRNGLHSQALLAPAKSKDGDDNVEPTYWPVLQKFSGSNNWPRSSVILPGNEVIFSLETASHYVKDDKACSYGFKCQVIGYEWSWTPEEGLKHLEKELAYLGGMCITSLMRKDLLLPPASVDEMEEDLDVVDDIAQQVYHTHSWLLSKGFALLHPPTVLQALEGVLPFSYHSNERAFLKDLVLCAPGTSGGRLARWLQPDSYVDPKHCEAVYGKEELRCGWPTVVTIVTKDQYGQTVHVPNLKVEVKAIPIDKDRGIEDSNHKIPRFSKPDLLTFGGHPQPNLDVPYEVTVKEKMCYYAISMMKAYENYSFEELRYTTPVVKRPSESMMVRGNNDGTYSANWTPGSAGCYRIHISVDSFEIDHAQKVDVKESPQGMMPPSQSGSRKNSHHHTKTRKFVAKFSAGLRVRAHPSLQSEQIGIVHVNGVISFIDEVHNDDGVWVRLNADTIKKFCANGRSEAWCLQFNQHLGKTLLVPFEEPKTFVEEILKEGCARRMPDLGANLRVPVRKGGPGLYHVVKCGASGHNIRCRPSLKAPPVGMLVLGNQVNAYEELSNSDGTWLKLDKDSMRRYCFNTEGEAWSLSVSRSDVIYLEHEEDMASIAEPEPVDDCDEFMPNRSADDAVTPFDFSAVTFINPFTHIASGPFSFSNSKAVDEVVPASPNPFQFGTTQSRDWKKAPPVPRKPSKTEMDPNLMSWPKEDAPIPPVKESRIPPELAGVSVKELIKVLGETQANGNDPTPPSSPLCTPRRLSRSSSPKAPHGSSSRVASSSRESSPVLIPCGRDMVTTAAATGDSLSSSPVLGSLHGSSHRRGSAQSFSDVSSIASGTGECAHMVNGDVSESKTTASLPSHASETSGSGKVVVQAGTQTSPDGSKSHFSIGAGPKEEPPHRLSPKIPRKDHVLRQLRSLRERGHSPSPISSTATSSSSAHTTRTSKDPLTISSFKEPVKLAMSPSVSECLRAVFAAFLWHEGIVHDAMACASFLKFHPDLPKQCTPRTRPTQRVPETLSKEQRARQRHSVEVSASSYLTIQTQVAAELAPSSARILTSTASVPAPNANMNKNKLCQMSETIREEPQLATATATIPAIVAEEDGDIPPSLRYLVTLWETVAAECLKTIVQQVALPSPALANRSSKSGSVGVLGNAGAVSANERRDRALPADRKSRKKKDWRPVASGARGNLFGEAAGVPFGSADRETVCELCGNYYPHPVTYHMRQAHPGCGGHAGGKGYNSGGNFCGGWAGNCGDGGVGGSSWYLICERCRERYLRQKRQVVAREKSRKSRRKPPPPPPPPLPPTSSCSATSGNKLSSIPPPLPQPPPQVETHLAMKENAIFLLDLACGSSSGTGSGHHRRNESKSTSAMASLSERSVVDSTGACPVTGFGCLAALGAQHVEPMSSIHDDFLLEETFGRRSARSGKMEGRTRTGMCSRQPPEDSLVNLHSLSENEEQLSSSSIVSPGATSAPGTDPSTSVSDSESPRSRIFHRSISVGTTTASREWNREEGDGRVIMIRKRNKSSGEGVDSSSLLCNPSSTLTKLVSAASEESYPRELLCRPVMAFIMQRHDLQSLQLSMRQAIRKATCRAFAMQALNWLLKGVTHPTCLHDLLWFFVAALTPPHVDLAPEDEEDDGEKKERKEHDHERDVGVCDHPLTDITLAGEAVRPLVVAFHTLLQTISDLMLLLPMGSAVQQMAVRCWCLHFRQSDHVFLHSSHVFSNISKILSRSEEELGADGDGAASVGDSFQMTCWVESLRDLTAQVEIKASSRQTLVVSLTDNSTETFWESGDEDRNKAKVLSLTWASCCMPRMVYVHIDNCRDLGNKVSSVIFKSGTNADDVAKLHQVEVESRYTGWIGCCILDRKCTMLKLEMKGPDNTLRVRQLKLLGEVEGESLRVGRFHNSTVIQQRNCEAETLKVFRLLTAQVFGRLIAGESDEDNEQLLVESIKDGARRDDEGKVEGNNDLKEHMVGILFSRSKLTHLQKQVCTHIVQAIRKEAARVREDWEALLCSKSQSMEELPKTSDAYCFEMLSMVLALSGSGVGRNYLSQQYGLLRDLLSLLHTGSARVQRQVTSLLRRVLPEVSPQTFASIVGVETLPPTDYSIVSVANKSPESQEPPFNIHRMGILDVFLSCIAKALTVQTKVKGKESGKGITTITLATSIHPRDNVGCRWWLRGCMARKLAEVIIQLLRDMATGKLSETWASVMKGAVAENILNLTKVEERYRSPTECLKTPTLWLALASLCVLEQDHVERLSSGQWVGSSDGQQVQPRPSCDNHDDGETSAIILCTSCGNLCADCDRYLHLHRRTRSHQRQVFKEEEEAIKVDLHEGCGRTKLFWVMALADSKTLKAMVEFREGARNKTAISTAGTCRFCGTTGETGLLAIGNVCSDPECQEHARSSCCKTLTCGHVCSGIVNESPCLPCLHGCSGEQRLKQDADDMCMICFTEALSCAPAIQLTCGHVFHLHCCRNILMKRWAGPRITFSFSLCPICKSNLDHPVLKDALSPVRALYEDVRRKALMRLEYEGLHKAEAITSPGARFYNDSASYAMERYAYYVCYKCKKAYFGGEARCDAEAGGGDEYDPTELVCGACSDVSRAQMCPKHGTDFLEYKCRYCCSVAVFFCFGTTHFCNACHDDFQHITNIPKHELPHCPAGPKAKQLEGEECPLHVQHPPTGEEFALGCGVCRNAHTF